MCTTWSSHAVRFLKMLEDDITLKIYWCRANKVVFIGTARVSDLVVLCLTNQRPPL
ncbi:MAG: hypothetical protein SVW57_15500 [Thermodesulfobacteriota bacterium]|nr:hypothetical protein [Thermodesulfobacteriota bacterium]